MPKWELTCKGCWVGRKKKNTKFNKNLIFFFNLVQSYFGSHPFLNNNLQFFYFFPFFEKEFNLTIVLLKKIKIIR